MKRIGWVGCRQLYDEEGRLQKWIPYCTTGSPFTKIHSMYITLYGCFVLPSMILIHGYARFQHALHTHVRILCKVMSAAAAQICKSAAQLRWHLLPSGLSGVNALVPPICKSSLQLQSLSSQSSTTIFRPSISRYETWLATEFNLV